MIIILIPKLSLPFPFLAVGKFAFSSEVDAKLKMLS